MGNIREHIRQVMVLALTLFRLLIEKIHHLVNLALEHAELSFLEALKGRKLRPVLEFEKVERQFFQLSFPSPVQ